MTTTVQSIDTHSNSKSGVSPQHEPEAFRGNHHMNQDSADWIETFRTLFASKVTAYHKGTRNAEALFSQEDHDFLRTIGSTPHEIFDYVEDWCDNGAPDPDTILAITGIRREYFLQEQQGQFTELSVNPTALPSGRASLAGLTWFPRIIGKAQAKLRGELPSDLMYSCGGDRGFLKKVHITPDEFLREVWKAGDNVDHLVQFLTDRTKS